MLNTDLHRNIIFMIIKDIFESTIWSHLAFKGGTACYFLYGLDRFSTDLDFDLLDDVEIDAKLIEILTQYWTVKKWAKLILSYADHDVNIKIDINRKIRKHNTYDLVNFYGTTIKVQDKATIFANKLVALTERNTNRDIYDVYFMFTQLFDINHAVINERTWLSLTEFLVLIQTKLKKLPIQYKILDGLWEVLTNKQKSFVQHKLLKALIWIIDMRIQFG